MSSVVIAGDTSGSVTLQAPATAGSPILTLPTTSGTLLTSATNNISASNITTGTLPYAQLPTGSVLQVVQASTTSRTAVSNTSTYAATSLTASITPKFATSKILVLIVAGSYIQRIGTGLADFGMGFAIYRNGSSVFQDSTAYNGLYISTVSANVVDNVRSHISTNYLDSPATTSSTTYTLYINAYQGNSAIGDGTAPSTITLMEIAG